VRCPRLLFARRNDDERPSYDPVEQIGLPWFELDQPAEHIEEIQQVFGVFGEPAPASSPLRQRLNPFPSV
jgi:hypothetical protein